MPYRNPVIPGFYPDPSVCRVGEDYYLVTSSFEYFPGVPLFHSRDLVNWRQVGHCLTRTSQLDLAKIGSSGGIYAPTLRYHNGTFYMITTNVNKGKHLIVTAKDVTGEWSDPVWVAQEGIDPSLFFDDDGKVYFEWTMKSAIYQAEIDVTTGSLLSEPRLIWHGTGGRYPEAPHLYKINGRYYLLIAEGGTEYGHMVTIARGSSPWGPFESCPRNPIATHRNDGPHPIQATGHGDLVQAQDGTWWMVCLAFRTPGLYQNYHHLGRETFLAPVTWDAEGWPVVGSKGMIELEMPTETLPQHPWEEEPALDDFTLPTLNLGWNFLREPLETNWSLTERPGWLRLRGSAVTLNDSDAPAFIGRRQQHFTCTASVCLDFAATEDGDEAGLTVLMNEHHHYELAVTRLEDKRHLIVRKTIGDLAAIVARITIEDGILELYIQADPHRYTFQYKQGAELRTLATGEARYLSSEVAGGFTGVYIAMYATGNGKPASVPADFDWFRYEHP